MGRGVVGAQFTRPPGRAARYRDGDPGADRAADGDAYLHCARAHCYCVVAPNRYAAANLHARAYAHPHSYRVLDDCRVWRGVISGLSSPLSGTVAWR